MANPLLFPSALARDKMAAMPRLKLGVNCTMQSSRCSPNPVGSP